MPFRNTRTPSGVSTTMGEAHDEVTSRSITHWSFPVAVSTAISLPPSDSSRCTRSRSPSSASDEL